MIYNREANAIMHTASGKRYPIEGYGDLPLTFRSSSGEVPLLLCNVAHVLSLNCHLLSLRVAADNGHTNTENKNGFTVKFKTGETLLFPSVGRLTFLYAYRPDALNYENANAVVAPGPEPSNRGTPVDINPFHAAHAHAHRVAILRCLYNSVMRAHIYPDVFLSEVFQQRDELSDLDEVVSTEPLTDHPII